MSYELIVACRREPPAPEQGWLRADLDGATVRVEPAAAWEPYVASHLQAPPATVLVVSRVHGVPEAPMWFLCCALADAGHGVVLAQRPVIFPPQYELRYTGQPLSLSWPELRAHQEQKAQAAAREAETRQQRQMAEWEAKAAADPETVAAANDWSDVEI